MKLATTGDSEENSSWISEEFQCGCFGRRQGELTLDEGWPFRMGWITSVQGLLPFWKRREAGFYSLG
jgi:hypothetical protein